MGRAQKLKEERKKEREAQEKRRAKKKTRVYKSAVFLVIFFFTFYGLSVVYSKYSNKNGEIGESEMTEEKEIKSPEKTGDKSYASSPEMQIDSEKEYTATFKTSKGEFKVKLYASDAPKTVNNFVFLARDKFYDGLIFHRIISDFMIQGGDPNRDGTGDPGYKFEDEFNDHKLVRGTLAMANSGPDTNGSQFFVVTKESTDWLDGKHTAFGEVIEGIELVMDIDKVDVGENDKPAEDVVIESVTIEEK